jgi:hypothetical protein
MSGGIGFFSGGGRPRGAKLNIEFAVLVLILCYQIITKNVIRMSQQETVNPTAPDKKKVRKEIGEKLTGALAEYKQELGEKKLATRVKEVSKLISRDLLKISKKQKKSAKKTKVKVAKKVSKKTTVK